MRSKGVGVESVLWEMGVKVARDQHCLFVIMEFVLWPERERERERPMLQLLPMNIKLQSPLLH